VDYQEPGLLGRGACHPEGDAVTAVIEATEAMIGKD
jgi:hypothetical protein